MDRLFERPAIVRQTDDVAELYSFDGFHDRIGWNNEEAKKAYIRRVTYG